METAIKSSIIRLKAYHAVIEETEPYRAPHYTEGLATGFLLTGGAGLIVTNFHVVRYIDNGRLYRGNPFGLLSDPIKPTADVGKRDSLIGYFVQFGARKFYLEVVSACPEYDLAICKFTNPDDIVAINQSTQGLEITDSLDIKEGQSIWIAGYPLENSLKISQGNISGISSLQDRCDSEDCRIDTPVRKHCFIQHTAPTNGGNSGGPLMISTEQGGYKVIGVVCSSLGGLFSQVQNVNYAVPSRLVYSAFYGDIFSRSEILSRRPNNAFRWSIVQKDLINHLYGPNCPVSGIRICNIFPDSWMKSIKSGDVICGLEFVDSMTTTNQIVAQIDNDGIVKLNVSDRPISINELFELIPFGTEVIIKFYRDNVLMKTTELFVINPLTLVVGNFPRYSNWEVLEYRIIAGMLFLSYIPSDEPYIPGSKGGADKRPYKKKLLISTIFNISYVKEVDILSEKDSVVDINGNSINSFNQLDSIIDRIKSSRQNYLLITTKQGNKMFIPMERAIQDDKLIRTDIFNY